LLITNFGAGQGERRKVKPTIPKNERSQKSRFLKKAAQKLSGIGAGGCGGETPQTQINKSFLLLFYKKAGLPLLKSQVFAWRRQFNTVSPYVTCDHPENNGSSQLAG
jgi:hypothetical protein